MLCETQTRGQKIKCPLETPEMRIQAVILMSLTLTQSLDLQLQLLYKTLDRFLGRRLPSYLLGSAPSSLHGIYLVGTAVNATNSFNPHKVMK